MQTQTIQRSSLKTETMQLLGLQGQTGAQIVNDALSSIPGVAEVSISATDEKATVTYDTAQVNVKLLQTAIADVGYESLKPVHGEDGNCCGGCGG